MKGAPSIEFHDLHPPLAHFQDEVLAGLRQHPPYIPPKFFYDERGSQLFDGITQTQAYYPTRAETEILTVRATEIAERVGAEGVLLEPGGGSCIKVRLLLDALRPRAFVPMDISREHLRSAAEALAADFRWLEIHAECSDFTHRMELPPTAPQDGPRLAFFPGSSIGNFDPEAAVRFIGSVADLVGPEGFLLIGVDLRKSKAILEAAYDDPEGITAAFNLNLLERINRELGADFDLSAWRHRALYNESLGRVEMHLVSDRQQRVEIAGAVFDFSPGDHIHTENSYKYAIDGFQGLARQAGMTPVTVWTDEQGLFSVHLLQNAAGR